MEQSDENNVMQLCLKIDYCNFEDESMRLLFKCEWRKLIDLNLMNNSIGDCSIESLHCANWPLLNSINLGKNDIIKVGNVKIGDFVCLNLVKLRL